MTVFNKLYTLTWKCFTLRKKNWILTAFEFVCPILVTLSAYILNYLSHDIESAFEIMESQNIPSTLNVSYLRNLAYYPDNPFTNNIMKNIHESGMFPLVQEVYKHNDESKLTEWLKDKTMQDKHEESVGILFLEINTTNKHFSYKIRTNSHQMFTKKTEVALFEQSTEIYEHSSFLLVQILLDRALLKSVNINYEEERIYLGKLPKKKDIFAFAIYMIYLFVMLAYVFLVASVVKEVLQEKATGIKELMKILGVSNWMIWVHWFIYTLMVHLPVTIVMTVLLAGIPPPLLNANAFIVWLLLFLFTIDCTLLLFTVSCLFNGPLRGTAVSVVGWFVLHFSTWYFIDKLGSFEFYEQILMSWIPLHNLCTAIYTIFSFTNNGKEWTFYDLFSKGFTGSQISVGVSLAISLFKIIIWSLLFTFLDYVKPGPYGVAKSWKFLYHWCVKPCLRIPNEQNGDVYRTSLPKRFELPPRNAKVGIQLHGLHKEYGLFKKFVAVENIDLNIYEGEIMALLGHNGAGKTTTMSMITGMFSPTRGVVLVDNINIHEKLTVFRQSLGLCTQHNMYFPALTVLEHLVFFGMLKGASYTEAVNNGKELLYLLNIYEKKDTRVSKLSGGMIRRLCLAMSLIGNPKVLILDEPTSGLDPENRHKIWDIILKMRGSRTILITTHFMEEAEILGDRIAIMDRGQVVCCGTTMFLKKIYGTGYKIHILKEAQSSPEDIYSEITKYNCKPKMRVVSTSQVDISIKENYVGIFPKLFENLEKQKKSLGINSISVTCTTLEDVFLRVAEMSAEGDQEVESDDSEFILSAKTRLSSVVYKTTGSFLLCQQFKTLIWKRLLYRYRNYLSSIIRISCCFILVFLMIWFSRFDPEKIEKQNPLTITLRMYLKSVNLVVNDKKNHKIANISSDLIKKQEGTVLRLPETTNITQYVLQLEKHDPFKYTHNTLLALMFLNNSFTILYQPLVTVHIPAIAVNLISNILLKNDSIQGNITVINHPYVLPQDEKCGDTGFFIASTPFFWMFYIFCFIVILMMDFIPFITEERASGFKHQQITAGVSPILYWTSNFVCDFLVYLCMVFSCLLVILLVGKGAVTWDSQWVWLIGLILIIYGISGLLFLYTFTFMIDNSIVCSSMFLMVNMAFALVPAFIIYLDIVRNFPLFFAITTLFSLNPTFAATISTGFIAREIVYEQLCNVCRGMYCTMKAKSLWHMPTRKDKSGISLYVNFLSLCWILYLILIILREWDCVRRLVSKISNKKIDTNVQPTLEDDVKKEADHVVELKESGDESRPLRVEGLVKKYYCGPKAVNLVSFALERGECFGLLGVNGAGKTTTFKILTGDLYPSSGDAFVKEYSVITNKRKYLSCIGYCPQSDALLNVLTGEETLKIIAKIRGIPRKDVKGEVNFLISMLGIEEHAKKCTVTYSGGTKRKLSTAVAFIGNPNLVFLDEPTTGVDPVSRRKLWSVVQVRQKAGQAVVLTSHSMEECEALCNRLTIMRDGQMQCVGTIEYLKQKYGKGFIVHIKLIHTTETELIRLKTEFFSLFPKSFIKDEHDGLIHYQILDPNMLLSKIFFEMLQLKEGFDIVEDFSVSNTTLEQLFLTFAEREETPVKRKTFLSLL